MTAQLGPPLIGHFAPRPPLRFLPPADTAAEKRVTPRITGVASYVDLLKEQDMSFVPTESWTESRDRRLAQKQTQNDEKLKEASKTCDNIRSR